MSSLLGRWVAGPTAGVVAGALAAALSGPAQAQSLINRQLLALAAVCGNTPLGPLNTQSCDISGSGDVQGALASVDDEQPGTGTNATQTSVAQIQTLRDRLYALREGATGFQWAGPPAGWDGETSIGSAVAARALGATALDPVRAGGYPRAALAEDSASGADLRRRISALSMGSYLRWYSWLPLCA